MSQATTIVTRPSDRKLAELRAAFAQRKDVQEAAKRAVPGILGEVLGGYTRAIRDDPNLLQCDSQTILDSLFDALDLGLVPGREGYFIRYGNRCHFQTGYRGILKLVLQGGATNPKVREVRQADTFRVEFGDEERIVHQMSNDPNRDEGPITHVYATVTLPDGERAREVWTTQRINEHKEHFSEAWKRATKKGTNDSPWHTSWIAMAQKTVLLALCKWLPQTTAMQNMLDVERKAEDDNTLDAVFSTVASHAAEITPAAPETVADKLPPQTPETPSETTLDTSDSQEDIRLSDDAVARLTNLGDELKGAIAIKQCQDLQKQAISRCEGVDEQVAIRAACDVRMQQIRDTRGERSNKV